MQQSGSAPAYKLYMEYKTTAKLKQPSDAQSAPGMSYVSFKVQKCPIFKVLNLKKEKFNGSALCYFCSTIPRPKFEKERKNLFSSF